jgi:hypothetical protein
VVVLSNLVYDILEDQIKSEIDKNIRDKGIKIHDVSIDVDTNLNIKVVLVSNEWEFKNIS